MFLPGSSQIALPKPGLHNPNRRSIMMSSRKIQQDARDTPVSACMPESLDDFERALYQFQSYFGDPTVTLAKTLERDPEFVIGHIFNASAMLMMSERQYLPDVLASIEKAEALAHKSNDREKGLVAAARHWMEGRWDQAGATWDQVLAEHPRDALAIQFGHLTDFYMGDAVNLRDRIGRVLGSWSESVPGYSYILGMQAFGLEECNQFARAEEKALKALSIDARDAWSVHAMAHVLEMENRYEEGQQFMRSRVDDWAPDNGFAFHNWWHLGLFHLEQDDFDGALQLYDEQILPGESEVSMQMLDASALLWRLHLQGVDLGSRWGFLADQWARKIPAENGYYAFNDMHAGVALVGADRLIEAREVLADLQQAAIENPTLTAMMARDVGVPALQGMIAFAEQRYDDVVDVLWPIRSISNRFGGSNAQRDILNQTLIEAAIRSGRGGLATNLLSEREVHKPFSPLTQRFKSRLPQ
jgi:tetratricopeptide (TPR) repeat protein